MIYTFYSYKGGVGRSMAMANVAECFCQQGLDVLMIDWDLEAPGLESFFYDPEPEYPTGSEPQPTSHGLLKCCFDETIEMGHIRKFAMASRRAIQEQTAQSGS